MKNYAITLSIFLSFVLKAQEIPADAQQVIKSIYTEALGQQQGYHWLHHICTEIGPRPSGSDASNEAARYTKEMMLSAGADTAWLHPVSYTHLTLPTKA